MRYDRFRDFRKGLDARAAAVEFRKRASDHGLADGMHYYHYAKRLRDSIGVGRGAGTIGPLAADRRDSLALFALCKIYTDGV
jgi:hypothetical protein